MAYWDTARPELALADFDKALALQPDYVEALMARGSLRLRHDNEAGARADFEVVQRMAPHNPGLLREMANAFVYAGNIDEGIARLDAWVEKHPKDMGLPMVLNDRCWLRATSNRELNLALADCDAALKKGARNSAVYDSRGFVHLRLGNYDKAIDDYKTAVKLQPRQATSLYGLGLARLKQGLTDLGNRDIATAIAINPNASDVYAKAGLTP